MRCNYETEPKHASCDYSQVFFHVCIHYTIIIKYFLPVHKRFFIAPVGELAYNNSDIPNR